MIGILISCGKYMLNFCQHEHIYEQMITYNVGKILGKCIFQMFAKRMTHLCGIFAVLALYFR